MVRGMIGRCRPPLPGAETVNGSAGAHVRLAGQPQYDAGDGSQDHIADLMSEVIAYLFEMIQIDEGNVQRSILVRPLE